MDAAATFGEDHPVVLECLDTLVRIMRGEEGYSGRYIGDRLRSCSQLLDRLKGTPRPEPERPDDPVTDYSVTFETIAGAELDDE